MNLFLLVTKGPTAWRDTLAVEDAIKHRSGSLLAAAVTGLVVFIVNFLQGTPYAHWVDFITPAMATQVGLLVAGVCVTWGHWATGAVLAGAAGGVSATVARPAGDGAAGRLASPAAPVGGVATDAGQSDQVRPGRAEAAGPTGDFMP
jgi:hypothetical protein